MIHCCRWPHSHSKRNKTQKGNELPCSCLLQVLFLVLARSFALIGHLAMASGVGS